MGILFAFLALLCWGLGDFLIEKSARRFGDLIALFYVTAFGAIALLPFVYKKIGPLFINNGLNLLVLLAAGAIVLVAGVLNFKSLKLGKISVVEPIFAFEVPLTAILATLILREFLFPVQVLLILLLFLGIILVAVRRLDDLRKIKMEKGVWLAILGTIFMGLVNFLMGYGSRLTDPLMINWFISIFIALPLFFYLLTTGQAGKIISSWPGNKKLIFAVSFFDNFAWIFFAAAVLYIPIAVATGISESYIALAAGLGLIINKEKLLRHQKIGLGICVVAVIILALVTNH